MERASKSFCGLQRQRTHSLRQAAPPPLRLFSDTSGSKYRLLKDTCHKGLRVKLFIYPREAGRRSVMVKLIWELGKRKKKRKKYTSISKDKCSKFGGYIMHAYKIHTALIASLIIYKWIIKHLRTLYQGNPGDQSLTEASSSMCCYF